jgi:hypothetical protein
MFNTGKRLIEYHLVAVVLWGLIGHPRALFASNLDPRQVLIFNQPRATVLEALWDLKIEKWKKDPAFQVKLRGYKKFDIDNAVAVQSFTEVSNIEVKTPLTASESLIHTYFLENPNGWDKPPTKVYYRLLMERTGTDRALDKESFFSSTTYADVQLSALKVAVDKLAPYVPPRELTSLQLRVLQTRKFNKSPNLVKEALSNLFKDEGGYCELKGPSVRSIGQIRPYDKQNPSKQVVDGYQVFKGGGSCRSVKREGFHYSIEVDTLPPNRQPNEPFWYDT